MPEEFKEYKRREHPARSSKKIRPKPYGMKALKQLIFSLIIFSTIFGFSLIPPLYPHIKSILTQKVDTSGITETLSKLINPKIYDSHTKEGQTNENPEVKQAP